MLLQATLHQLCHQDLALTATEELVLIEETSHHIGYMEKLKTIPFLSIKGKNTETVFIDLMLFSFVATQLIVLHSFTLNHPQ